MDLATFIVAVYCLIDEAMDESLGDRRLRERGPDPLFLDDKEVLTIEVVGEFLGIETPTGGSTPTFVGTTGPGSPPCARSIAPPSCAKRPTSGR